MTDALAAALARGPILLDAAMGTRLIARGLDLAREDPSLWVLDHPDEVAAIHRRDVAAGSDAVLTDTFGATRAWLARFGRAADSPRICSAAATMARQAAGPGRLVFGSIGPAASDDPAALIEQAEALAGGGVDALLLETHRPDQALAALDLLQFLGRPVLASLHSWPEPADEVADLARRLAGAGAVAIGGNCLPGVDSALTLARRLRGTTDLPLLLKPAAGLPGQTLDVPGAFAAALPEWLRLGVRLVGGCCGTTEAHVGALRRVLDT